MASSSRECAIKRATGETKIDLRLSLDGSGLCNLASGVGFFDHMLQQLAVHGAIDLDLKCTGDLQVDAHHTVEDVGIVLGQALDKLLKDKKGLTRFASCYAPLDDALSRAVIDLSGRAHLQFNANFTQARINDFDTELVREFFQAVVNHARITLHLDNLRGINSHHQVESLFKAFAIALRQAVVVRGDKIASSKGVL